MNPTSIATNTRIHITAANQPKYSFADDVRRGLSQTPKILYPKYLYDERGSKLFAKICTLPEYYQTRTEQRILDSYCDQIIQRHQPTTLVEYGAGAATKTRTILDAMRRADLLGHYIPIDVSADFLHTTAEKLLGDYPELTIHGLTGDFLEPIRIPHENQPRLIVFLGSTIGNLTDAEAKDFFRLITNQMTPKDRFLLGTDLVKDIRVLEDAYNDSRGITARFSTNMLRIINRELGGEFLEEQFQHHAFYNPRKRQIEIHLVARESLQVRITDIDLTVPFEKGESIRTEISGKYSKNRVRKLLDNAGLEMLEWYTDTQDYFAISVSQLLTN